MRIGIIGAGNVGSALGMNWRSKGRDVRFGVPNPDDSRHARLGRDALGTPPDIARDADVVVLATPWDATEPAVRGLGNLSGKIVIDCTNPLTSGPEGLGLAIGFTTSGGEQVATWAAGASVFKALNQTGAANMSNPETFTPRPLMFVAGDDATRKPLVIELVDQLGFEAMDAGPLRMARLLEPLALLWIDQALNRDAGLDFAFAITRRS